MPTVPWTPTAHVHAGTDYLIMATRFTLVRRRDMLRVISATSGLWSGIRQTDGLIGYSISSRSPRGTLATLSAWRDRDAMLAFVRGDAHQEVIDRTRDQMRGSTFASWNADGAELPPDWTTAAQRLEMAHSQVQRPQLVRSAELA